VANPEEARRRGIAAREAALERYGLGKFQQRWDELLGDLVSTPTHSLTASNDGLDERILVPARERKTP
jgi:hypothetical protein